MMKLKVVRIDPGQDDRWDAFVMSHPDDTIYHHSCWAEVLRSTYGHELVYLALEDEGKRIRGIAPFMLLESRLTGSRMVSLPFTSYCAPILPAGEVEKVLDYLSAQRSHIDYIELKIKEEDDLPVPGTFSRHGLYVTHILSLDAPPEELFSRFQCTSVRQRVRKAERNGLVARKAEGLRHFYRLHTLVRRKHGLPPHPYAFFLNIWRCLGPGNRVHIPLVEHENEVVAAAVILKFKKTYHLEYSAVDPRRLALCGNQMLIWESIKEACGEGAGYFDFGRSALSHRSLIEFKERWNAKRIPLSSYYYPQRPLVDTENSVARKVLNLANRHLPLSLLEIEGKLLYPHLG